MFWDMNPVLVIQIVITLTTAVKIFTFVLSCQDVGLNLTVLDEFPLSRAVLMEFRTVTRQELIVGGSAPTNVTIVFFATQIALGLAVEQ
jgi:hypothetical protein